jgi:hypothetical protein
MLELCSNMKTLIAQKHFNHKQIMHSAITHVPALVQHYNTLRWQPCGLIQVVKRFLLDWYHRHNLNIHIQSKWVCSTQLISTTCNAPGRQTKAVSYIHTPECTTANILWRLRDWTLWYLKPGQGTPVHHLPHHSPPSLWHTVHIIS